MQKVWLWWYACHYFPVTSAQGGILHESWQLSHGLHVLLNQSRAVWGVSASIIVQPHVTLNQGMIVCDWLGETLWKHWCFARAIWPDMAILSQHRLLSTNDHLTAVESLEASVISRLPLSPSRAGTRMNTSFTSVKTVQCCKKQSGKSLTQHQYAEDTDILHLDISSSY